MSIKKLEIIVYWAQMAAGLKAEETKLIIRSIVRGDTRIQTMDKFEKEFGRAISELTVSRIKKRNLAIIAAAKQEIVVTGAISAVRVKEKVYKILDGRLERALKAEDEVAKYRKQWQQGDITEAEFKEHTAAYEQLTINELVKIADHAQSASKGKDDDPFSPSDQAALALLMEGIKSGNPMALIQAVNPGGFPTAGTPAPQQDSQA